MAQVDRVVKTHSRPAIPPSRRDFFTKLAAWTIRVTGGRWGFVCAFGVVLIWALLGPYCHYSETWQLVINTGTTIVTFLMVFLIQNAQNRESKAIHLKLDELILAVAHARNELIDIEKLTDEQLDLIAARYKLVADKNHHKLETVFFEGGKREQPSRGAKGGGNSTTDLTE
jgi:low affinity Fe/Cu permease